MWGSIDFTRVAAIFDSINVQIGFVMDLVNIRKFMLQAAYRILVLLAIYLSAPLSASEQITIYIRDDVLEDYQSFVGERNVLTITDFNHRKMRRDVADMVLLQQALALGGFNKAFQYLPGKVNFRNTKMLETGELLLSFDSYWLSDAERLENAVFISHPIINKGEYFAAVYTSPKNQKALALRKTEDLKQLTGVSTPKWHTDWQTMSKLPLKQLIQEDEWLSQARIVHMGWVDIMLMPFFHDNNGIYQLEQIKLQRIPEVAVLLDDSRHFVISRHHPEGEAAYQAIQRGLQILRKSGQIEKMYRQAGFLIDPTQFTILNAKPASL